MSNSNGLQSPSSAAYWQSSRLVNTTVLDPCEASHAAYESSLRAHWTSLDQAAKTGAFPRTTVYYTQTFYSYSLTAFGTYVSYLSARPSYAWWTTPYYQTLVYTDYQYPSFTIPYPTCHHNVPCGQCTLYADNVQLIYWPVSTVSGHPESTITPTGTPTGVFNGTSYASGSVYLQYDLAGADNACGPVGNTYPGAVITLRSDDVSSLLGDGTYFYKATSFNFANLNWPYNYEAVRISFLNAPSPDPKST